MEKLVILSVIVAVFMYVSYAFAQKQVYVFPAKEQSKDQQDKDEYDCRKWAIQQSGVDPEQVARQSGPSYPASGPGDGRVVRGSVRGAALGAVGGAIAGDTGKGAEAGAAIGALGGAMRRRDANRQQQAAQQQASMNSQHMLENIGNIRVHPASRFNRPERKLMEKVFKIEG